MTPGNSGGTKGKLLGRLLPVAAVAVFLVLFGTYLTQRNAAARPALTAASVEAAESIDGSAWMAILYQGKRIGWSHTTRARHPEGETVDEEVTLRMTLMGQARDVQTRQRLELDREGTLKTFEFRMQSKPTEIRVQGRQEKGALAITLYSAGVTETLRFDTPEPIVMSGALPRSLVRGGLAVGKTFTRSFFDPSIMRPSTMTVKVEAKEEWKIGARTLDVYKLAQTFNGLESTTWIDADGTIYREESPTGFSSFRTTREDAMKLGDGPSLDLIAAASVPVENPIANPREVRKVVLRLEGVELDGFDLDGGEQTLEGNRLTIDRNAKVPASIAPEAWLKSEPLLQVDDPQIRAAMREATGGLADKAEASRRLLRWVYANLEKTSTVSLPSALEVLRTRQGDCNEHAILYTALARASQIPSRIASGVVALDERFYYHAWTEIHLDGRWQAVDPVFGQYPADATHIRFVVGGLDRQAELMRVIGRLKIKVEKAE